MTENQTWEDIKTGLKSGLDEVFPIIGKKQELHLTDIDIKDNKDASDYASQKKAVLNGSNWTVPVHGTVELKDKAGKVVDKKKMRLLSIPKTTDRGTIIYNGTEYNITNQLRLKPGVYTSVGDDEVVRAQFNMDKGANFELWQDPVNGVFFMKFQQSSIPLYPALKELGVGDGEMVKAWGKKIADSNKAITQARYQNALKNLYKKLTYSKDALPFDESVAGLKEVVEKADIGGTSLSPQSLLQASLRILRISRKEEAPDDRESLAYKTVYGPEDFIKETVAKGSRSAVWKLKSKMDGYVPRNTVSEVMAPGTLSQPIYSNINASSLVNPTQDANPLSLLEGKDRITSFGPGSITSVHAIPEPLRNIHPSHIGFIDPVRTPESNKSGIDLQIARNTNKSGTSLSSKFIDRAGKIVTMTPAQLADKVVAFPGQTHKKTKIDAVSRGKQIVVSNDKVDYYMPDSQGMFSVTTNLVPLLSNNAGARVNVGGKMQSQSLSLKYREAPLVQSESNTAGISMEKEVAGEILPSSPIDGEVISVNKGSIRIKGSSGNTADVGMYDNYVIGGKNFIDSSPVVKKGDKVKKGQILADSNYTKDGTLAIGVNLKTAYVPFKGLTHEDGIVVSETASKKLTSQHMYRFDLSITADVELNKDKYSAYFGSVATPSQMGKLDSRGIITPGSSIDSGDYLVAAMRDSPATPDDLLLGKLSKKLAKPYKDVSVLWEKDYKGTVVDVISNPRQITVTVRADTALVVGDKLTNRAGGKGVVTAVLPDSEMPYNNDTKAPYEVLLNPATIMSRMNMGQLTETAAAKTATKDNPYIAPAFPKKDENITKVIQDRLKKFNVKEVDNVYDASGEKVGDIFAGDQYILKLNKTTEGNFSARAGGGGYDADMQPVRGGSEGAKSMGMLDEYALLSHNARNILRESVTSKAEYNPEMWHAIQTGKPLPPPKPTFAFNKFTTFLKGAGVNVDKRGDRFKLLPLTDKDTISMSSGRLLNAKSLHAKGLREEEGGLFDISKTGGKGGTKWSHIKLKEPVLNPIFVEPARRLLGMKKKELLDMQYTKGGQVIKDKLSEINVKSRLAELKGNLGNLSGVKKDEAIKQIKYLTVLNDDKMKPEDAYTMSNVPVIPPVFRPIYQVEGTNNVRSSDANELYKQVMLVDQGLSSDVLDNLPDTEKTGLRRELFQSVKVLQGLDKPGEGKDYKGFIAAIKGDTPKEGFFQSKVLSKRQDIAGRATIGGDPELGLDEAKIPEKMAWTLYGPFTIRELVKSGMSVMDARQAVEDQTDKARAALMLAMSDRPVLLNRAPTLHKFNIMAFKPKPYKGKTLMIPPMVAGPYSADYDGDSCINSVQIRTLGQTCKTDLYQKDIDTSKLSHYNTGEFNNENIHGGINMPFNSNTTIRYQYGVVNLKEFPHGELIKTEGNKEVYTVPGDIQVLTVKDGVKKWLPVESYSVHKNLSMAEVTTNTSRTIQCSMDHSLVTVDKDLNYQKCVPTIGATMPRLREAVSDSEIDVIDSISLPAGANNDSNQPYKFPDTIKLDKELGYFHGAYIGDGWTNKCERERNAICLVAAHQEIVEYIKGAIQKYNTGSKTIHFSRVENPHEFDGSKAHSTKYTWYSDRWAKYLKQHMPHGAINKKLPSFWMHSPEEFRWGLLSGLIDTDGSIGINNSKKRANPQTNVKYSTISQVLAYEIVALAHTLNLTASVSVSNRPTSAGNTDYVIDFTQESIEALKRKLVLSNPQKRERLAGFAPAKDYKRNKYTPKLTAERLGELSKAIGRLRTATRLSCEAELQGNPEKPMSKTEAQVVSKGIDIVKRYNTLRSAALRAKSGNTAMTRQAALDIIDLDLEIFTSDQFWSKWKNMVLDESIEWELITSVKPIPFITEAYDLTIPPAYTMVTESGIVIYDTMQVHVPVSEAARLEATNTMMPSQNLFSIRDKSPHYTPSNEAILGLNIGTQGKKTIKTGKKTYTSDTKVKNELRANKLKPDDMIVFNGILCPAGSVAVNSVLPVRLRDYKRVITKKTLKDLLGVIGKDYSDDYASIAKALKDMGDDWAYSPLSSFSFKDFEVYDKPRNRIFADAASKLSRPGNKSSFVDIYSGVQNDVQKQVMADGKASGNVFHRWVDTGSRGNPMQLASILGAPTMVEDLQNKKVEVPIKRNFIEGLTPSEFYASLYGTRKGIAALATSVSAPGALAKELVASNIDLVITMRDCGTSKGIQMSVGSRDITNRMSAVDINGKSGIIARKGSHVDSRTVDLLKKDGIKSILVRSSMTCEAPKGVCSICAGIQENGNLPSIGENLGIKHSMSISEPLTQIAISTKHTAGVGGSSSPVKRIQSILEMPTSTNVREVLAEHDGSISSITKLPAGGRLVKIKGVNQETEHTIPSMRTLTRSIGDKVSIGDPLTDGVPNIAGYTSLKGIEEGRKRLADTVGNFYRDSGVRIDSNIPETISRGILNYAKVTDPGDHEFKVGDIVEYNQAKQLQSDKPIRMPIKSIFGQRAAQSYKKIKQGDRLGVKAMRYLNQNNIAKFDVYKKPLRIEPVAYGINKIPTQREDWLSRMGFQHISKTITEGAATGAESNIHSNNPIPALSYGAEFGSGANLDVY